MPRAADGTYSLPAGNPVVTLTVISSNWANTTLSDLSTAMTGSLSRSGDGGMLAPLKLNDGAIGAPGLAWGTETTSGLYRNAANDFRYSIASTELLRLNTNLVQLSGTAPTFRFNESDGAVDNRLWEVIASGEDMAFRVLSDALSPTNWLVVSRTASVVDSVILSTNLLQLTSTAPLFRINESDAAANNRLWDIIANGEDLSFRVLTDALAATNWLVVTRTAAVVDTLTFTYGGTGPATFEGLGVVQSSTTPFFEWNETDGSANNKRWLTDAAGEQMRFRIVNDNGTGSLNWLTVDRTANVIDLVDIITPLFQVQGIHNGTAPTGTNHYIASGTYTPTLTNTTNIDASTASVCQWSRVGRVVTVAGTCAVDCTTVGVAAVMGLSLPIASNLASSIELGGAGCHGAGAPDYAAVRFIGDSTNDRALVDWVASTLNNSTMGFIFSYLVN